MIECKDCKYWTETDEDSGDVNECRCKAPVPTGVGIMINKWPLTKANLGCGEGKPIGRN